MQTSYLPKLTLDQGLISELRTDLRAAQWNAEFLEWFFDGDPESALSPEFLSLSRHQLATHPDRAAALLSRFFLTGDKLSDRQLNQALPRTRVSGLKKLGIAKPVNQTETRWRATINLLPHRAQWQGQNHDWWIASDLAPGLQTGLLPDEYVLGVGGATLSLLKQTIRRPVRLAWDLGTGCGIQALYLALHAQEVMASDLSERCLNFAEFNALLAGPSISQRITFVQGSFTDPAQGKRFDQIVSNPPYVITPPVLREAGIKEYRDGGRAGDGVMAFLTRTLGEYLTPGGYGQLIGNWEIEEDASELARPRSWAQATKENFWIILRETQTPAQYASLWLQDSGIDYRRDRKEYQTSLQKWVTYFEQRRVAQIGFGFLHFQARDETAPGERQIWTVDARGTGILAQGEDVWEVFTAQNTQLAGEDCPDLAGPASFLHQHLIVAEDVAEQRFYQPGAPDPHSIKLVQGGHWGKQVTVDATLAGIVGACDGELSLQQIIAAVSTLSAIPVEQLAEKAQPKLWKLFQMGFLRLKPESEVAPSNGPVGK